MQNIQVFVCAYCLNERWERKDEKKGRNVYKYNSLRHYNECDRQGYQLEPKAVTRYHDR